MLRRFIIPVIALATLCALAALVTPSQAEEAAPALKPVITTYNLMEYLIDPAYATLETAMESEPADRRGWRDIRQSGEVIAEVSNLLLFRDDLEYTSTDEWKTMSVAMRTASEALVEASKTQDFAQAVTAYTGLVQSCNACHTKFEPSTAPTFKLPGE